MCFLMLQRVELEGPAVLPPPPIHPFICFILCGEEDMGRTLTPPVLKELSCFGVNDLAMKSSEFFFSWQQTGKRHVYST